MWIGSRSQLVRLTGSDMDISDGTLSHKDNEEQCLLAGKKVGVTGFNRGNCVVQSASTRLEIFQGSAISDFPISYRCYV